MPIPDGGPTQAIPPQSRSYRTGFLCQLVLTVRWKQRFDDLERQGINGSILDRESDANPIASSYDLQRPANDATTPNCSIPRTAGKSLTSGEQTLRQMELLMSMVPTAHTPRSATPFLGLAPFLRASIAGDDLLPTGQTLLAQAQARPGDAALLMNLSIAMQCLGQRDLGVAIQQQALSIQRVYPLPATQQPALLRVLMLMAAGDIAENTPLECLFETGDIELVHYFLTTGDPFAAPVPDHDVLIVALAESSDNRELLTALEEALADWPKPVVNSPQHIPATDRQRASVILHDAPGLHIPRTFLAPRTALQSIAAGERLLVDVFEDSDFPIILRPVGSQAGRDLDKLETLSDLAAYLNRVSSPEFFLSRFVDYRSPDGSYRKYRIALIDGVPYPCHMGISSHWMVHYVNAGMYAEKGKRDEEAGFMATFDGFALRHRAALTAIHGRIPLDYFCIDCAEAQDGRLLVFEIDHCMVVHAMDSTDLFPYKTGPMQTLKSAFQNYLLRIHEATR